MGIDATIARQFQLDEIIAKAQRKADIKERLRQDGIKLKALLDDCRRQEEILDGQLSRVKQFSDKWWFVLGKLNQVRRDYIEGRQMADEWKAMVLAVDSGTVRPG